MNERQRSARLTARAEQNWTSLTLPKGCAYCAGACSPPMTIRTRFFPVAVGRGRPFRIWQYPHPSQRERPLADGFGSRCNADVLDARTGSASGFLGIPDIQGSGLDGRADSASCDEEQTCGCRVVSSNVAFFTW